MNDKEKTSDQMREDMIRQLQESGAEVMHEIAMPGIRQTIDTSKV